MTKTPAEEMFDDEDEFADDAAVEATDDTSDEAVDDAFDETADDDDEAAEDEAAPEDDADEDVGDDELGDVIDGTEDEVIDEDTADVGDDDVEDADAIDSEDPAVAAAVRAVQQAVAKNTQRTVPMAANQKPAKKTKADYIREMIAHLKTKYPSAPLRPRDVIAALAKKGVEVTAPQVSVTLRDYEAGDKPAKTIKSPKLVAAVAKAEKAKTEKPVKPVAPTAEVNRPSLKVRTPSAAPAATGTDAPSFDALRRVSAFVRTAGGVAAARALIDSYAELLDPAG